MKSILAGILALTIAAAVTAWCQQAAAPARPTPASPQAAPAAPELASTMKALEEELRSVGRVTWSQNDLYGSGVVRKTYWEELTRITADPKSCSLRVGREISGTPGPGGPGPKGVSAYLDEISDVRVLASEDFIHRHQHFQILNRDGSERPDYEEDLRPPLYSVVVNFWQGFDLKFPTREGAEQFAALLRDAIKQCTALAATPQPAASAGPSLAETFSFIAEKLSSQDTANLRATIADANGETMYYSAAAIDYQVSPNPSSCTTRIDNVQLSFHRIGKIEVLTFRDYVARRLSDHPEYKITVASPGFVLYVTTPGGEPKQLYFSDEVLANRVAKAMVHAAELCGAGSNKEPF